MNVFNTQANIFKVNGGLADDFANRPAPTGSYYIFWSTDTGEIFYDDGTWIQFGGGGGGGFYFADTYANIAALKAANNLVPGAMYFINDRSIIVTAINNNTFELQGSKFQYVIDNIYYQTLNCWESNLITPINTHVIWGGRVWKNISGTNLLPKINYIQLDAAEWQQQQFNTVFYLIKYFVINYNFDNDTVYYQFDPINSNSVKDDQKGQLHSDWGNGNCKYNTTKNGFYSNSNAGITFNDCFAILGNIINGGSIVLNKIIGGNIINNVANNIAVNTCIEISNNILPFGSTIVANNITGIIDNNLCSVNNNTNNGSIINNNAATGIFYNSNVGDIANNINSGLISYNSNNGSIQINAVNDITNNNNLGEISNNTFLGNIENNTNNGNIIQNTGVITNINLNNNNGSILDNAITGAITKNSNAGNIQNNQSNVTLIEHNSNTGNINGNNNTGVIQHNNNNGNIANNTCLAITNNYCGGNLSNNSNIGNISGNNIGGPITGNSNAGQIFQNINTAGIQNNSNNGQIYRNANNGQILGITAPTGQIYSNVNNGNILTSTPGNITDPIVNK